ncbi:hypothetical protein [Flavobacterium gawalongense]|uniref:Uncharacterized protein n=1 Tax=Flavobacterium gawalongense TaxID=2594432 RepID=A0A553BBG2_9FLAO|nr:hypothetical protein [Flavobacterium gawalongense]TRX01352.1 hypothetical protein FNW33_09570 [Flavobacterium gawalongense]TRX05569.1 hypothetical protein FNW11_15920 [Flavobacterium gawalongense]TRX05876.1 hypothetical protein FNW12_09655 [Flavobacterium gawalongense]TRX06410.1 hypothetical protein FNW10_15975 [Flavobacterium gawalongense]TRX22332.1 hypothetical protein FNW38_16010 [Flavobacterium gawalongense]
MKTATVLVKNIILPQLEKDPKFDVQKTNADFWGTFTNDLLRFEEDAKPLYASIYSLELDGAEKVISKLSGVYSKLLKELAESYVLGQSSEATEYLLKSNNDHFLKEVRFLQTMEQAIKSVERKRIKSDLPNTYDRLAFELSETDITNATKKKGREDLKEKMKQWDTELVEESDMVPVFSMLKNENKNKKQTKVISLSWMKYAVAASIIIATGIFYFKNPNSGIIPAENGVVTTEDKKGTTEHPINRPVIEAIVLAEIETSSRSITVLEPSSLGFTPSDKKPKVTVYFKDATQRIISLEKLIEKNKVSSSVDSKILDKYKAELADLKNPNEKYSFDGKTLTLFCKYDPKQYGIIVTEDQRYFLKKGSVFYNLKISSVSLPLEKVTDAATIESLEKITFENE